MAVVQDIASIGGTVSGEAWGAGSFDAALVTVVLPAPCETPEAPCAALVEALDGPNPDPWWVDL